MNKGPNWQVVEFFDWFNENKKYQIILNSYLCNLHLDAHGAKEFGENIKNLLNDAEIDWETERFENKESGRGNPHD